ncbi:MAG TPA: Crp/Fnr family transcriptional regulator [Xanthobacteraceae bacterium]|nr:Crp/Fnr family transcriptional regulator [Xanthobacteraceae bacterium]
MEQSLSTGRNRLLAVLGDAGRALLEPHLEEVPLDQGKLLQEQGDDIDDIYFPHSGMISLVTVMNKGGKIIETATVGREGAVGAMAGFGPRHAFRRAIVQVGGTAAKIATGQFQERVRSSEMLRDVLVRYNELLLAQVQQAAACNAFHDADQRLARWLLQTRDRIDSNTIPLTQEFLAQMLGVRRTTVTLIAQGLQERGYLRYRRGRVEIVDREGLESVACECYRTMREQIDEYFPRSGSAS